MKHLLLAVALAFIIFASQIVFANERIRPDGRGGYYTEQGHYRSDGRGGYYAPEGHYRNDGRGGLYTPDGGHQRSDGRGGWYK